MTGIRRIRLDLLAQAPNVNRDRRWVPREGRVPELIEQVIAVEHGPRAGCHEVKEVEFPRRQLDRPAVDPRLAGPGVDLELAEAQHVLAGAACRRGLPGSPENRSHPGHDLTRGEGLGDVVVGAQLEAHDAVGLLASGGEHDHRGPAPSPDPSENLEAVEGRLAIRRGLDLEALATEIAA